MRAAERHAEQADLCHAFDEVDDGDGFVDVRADAQHAVMAQQHRRPLSKRRNGVVGELFAGRRSVFGDGHRAAEEHDLLVEHAGDRLAGDGERAGVHRVRVDHGAHVGTRAVHGHVRERLARRDTVASDGLDLRVDDEHIIDPESMVRHAARRDGEEVARRRGDATADVAARTRHEARGHDAPHGIEYLPTLFEELRRHNSLIRSNASLIVHQRA